MKAWKIASFGLSLALSSLGSAYNFSVPDALFAKRAEGSNDSEKFKSATTAFDAYNEAFQTGSGEDKLYAYSQRGRLTIFRTLMLQIDESTKKELLKDFIKDSDKIIVEFPKKQESHYFLLACMGILGKLSSFFERVNLALKLKKVQWPALESTKSDGQYAGGFEGGGVLRIMAAVRGNLQAKPVGLYDPEEGLKFATVALESNSAVWRPFPDPMSGSDYYENFYYHAGALTTLGLDKNDLNKIHEAKNELTSTIELMNDLASAGALPTGREPELNFYQRKMQKLKADIETCETQAAWADCLNKRID